MEKESHTDKELYRNKNAKQIFKECFSTENIGHAVETLQVTKTHTNGSAGGREGVASDDVTIGHHPTVAKSTGLSSPFGGKGRKRYEHRGSDSPAKRRNKFKSLLDFWRGDQSDADNVNPEILGMMAEGRGSLTFGDLYPLFFVSIHPLQSFRTLINILIFKKTQLNIALLWGGMDLDFFPFIGILQFL